MLIEANPLLTIKDIMKVLRISEGITRHNIKKLRDEGIIVHKGSTKSGYWEIKQLCFRDRDIVNNKVQNEVQNEAQNVPQNVPQNDIQGDLSIIIELIRKNPKITREEMALAINKTIKTVQRIISECVFIKYVGPSKGGHWEIK